MMKRIILLLSIIFWTSSSHGATYWIEGWSTTTYKTNRLKQLQVITNDLTVVTGDIIVEQGSVTADGIYADRIEVSGDYAFPTATGIAAQALGVSTDTGQLYFMDVAAGAEAVTAGANITDHSIVRGDGGGKAVQDSGILIDDSDNVTGMGTLNAGAVTLDGTLTMGDNAIADIDTIGFHDTAGTIAGIQNQNLVDKAAAETISGAWDFAQSITADYVWVTNDLTALGNVSGATIGSITEANLVDKSAIEIISGAWEFTDSVTIDHAWVTNNLIVGGDIDTTGDVGGTTIGGITEANLLDKAAAETISGVWDFSASITSDYVYVTNDLTLSGNLTDSTNTMTVAQIKGAIDTYAVKNASFVVVSLDGDLSADRALTEGEGINLTDGGANSTLTVAGEDASETNKGIAYFDADDFTVSSGGVSIDYTTSQIVTADYTGDIVLIGNLEVTGSVTANSVFITNDLNISGNVASGTWQGVAIDEAYLDPDLVTDDFTGDIIIAGNIEVSQSVTSDSVYVTNDLTLIGSLTDGTNSATVEQLTSAVAEYVVLGETSTTAYRGDRGKTAYDNRVDTWNAPLSFASNAVSVTQADTDNSGYLSDTDWDTFNNKQATIEAGLNITVANDVVSVDSTKSTEWDAAYSASHTQGTDTTLGTMTANITMDSTYQIVELRAPAASGEAIRQTAKITESNMEAAHDHVSATGASHSYIDQDVTVTGTPEFASVTTDMVYTDTIAESTDATGVTIDGLLVKDSAIPATGYPDMIGDGGAGGTKGAVIAPGAGDAAANKFLKADATWSVPAGAGDVSGPGSSIDNEIAIWNGVGGDTLQDSGVFIDDSHNVSTDGYYVGDGLWDNDGDTGVQVEESANENIIRFDVGGTETVSIDSTGIHAPSQSVTADTLIGVIEGTCVDIVQVSDVGIVDNDTLSLVFDFEPSLIILSWSSRCHHSVTAQPGQTIGHTIITVTGTDTVAVNMNCDFFNNNNGTMSMGISQNDTTNTIKMWGGFDSSDQSWVEGTAGWTTSTKTLLITWQETRTYTPTNYVEILATAYR